MGLHDRQVRNQLIDQQKKVLAVVGLIDPGDRPAPTEVARLFEQSMEARVVSLQTGSYVEDVDANAFDQRRAAKDPETSRTAPENPARVRRVPDLARIYLYSEGEELQAIVLPIEGMGLWSTLYGFVAVDADLQTIRGLTYYEHGETPGLGGEVDNPRWKARWPGRRVFDDEQQVRIEVVRGNAGPPEADPYRVDGLAGATMTSRGVTNMLRFWMGEHGFRPYLERMRRTGGA